MRILWLLVCTLLVSCFDDPSDPRYSGGSAVEGETVTARLLDAEGAPLAGMALRATSPELPGWSVDASSDGSGVVRIAVPQGARELVLMLDHPGLPGQKLVFRIVLRPSLDTTLVARKWGGLTGRVVSPMGWTSDSVSIEGLGILGKVESGSFSIPHLPPGTWPLTLRAESLGTRRIFELGNVAMPDGGVSVYREFQVRSDIYFGQGFDDVPRWDSVAVCMAGNDFAGMSDSVMAGCVSSAIGTAAWSGSSLRLHLAGTANRMSGARLATVPAGSVGELLVSSGDTLSFMARGTGNLEVVIGIRNADGIRMVRAGAFRLAATWNRHAWPMSVWIGSDTHVAVAWIGFVTDEDAWMVLDKLELSGS